MSDDFPSRTAILAGIDAFLLTPVLLMPSTWADLPGASAGRSPLLTAWHWL